MARPDNPYDQRTQPLAFRWFEQGNRKWAAIAEAGPPGSLDPETEYQWRLHQNALSAPTPPSPVDPEQAALIAKRRARIAAERYARETGTSPADLGVTDPVRVPAKSPYAQSLEAAGE